MPRQPERHIRPRPNAYWCVIIVVCCCRFYYFFCWVLRRRRVCNRRLFCKFYDRELGVDERKFIYDSRSRLYFVFNFIVTEDSKIRWCKSFSWQRTVLVRDEKKYSCYIGNFNFSTFVILIPHCFFKNLTLLVLCDMQSQLVVYNVEEKFRRTCMNLESHCFYV